LGSHLVIPADFETFFDEIAVETLELPPGERAIISLQVSQGLYMIQDLVTHSVQHLDIKGEQTKEKQTSAVYHRPNLGAPPENGDASWFAAHRF
jgi:hypothetical protein